MPISDLTGTTWVLNTNVDATSLFGHEYFINFTSNNTQYLSISCALYGPDDDVYALYFDNDLIGGDTSGYPPIPSQYREISITGGTDVTNATLIAWLEANAVQQQTTIPQFSFKSAKLVNNVLTLNGVDYALDTENLSTVVVTPFSSFNNISAVDNNDGTITLTIGSSSITVNKVPTDGLLDSNGDFLKDSDGKILLHS